LIRTKLNKIVENYNNMVHRGIGMCPNDAMKCENFERVRKNEELYSKEFKRIHKQAESFKIGNEVLIRNEIKKNKMEDEFSEKGIIIKHEYGDVYQVKLCEGDVVRRHASQIRGI
jgi:hypothetical protein